MNAEVVNRHLSNLELIEVLLGLREYDMGSESWNLFFVVL